MTKYYGNSMIRALSSVYPEHDWNGWKFRKAPTSFWHSLEHRQQFFEWAAHKLQITAPEDWYLVGSAQIHELGSVFPHPLLEGSLTSNYGFRRRRAFATYISRFGRNCNERDIPYP
jgi:hypothetical protein